MRKVTLTLLLLSLFTVNSFAQWTVVANIRLENKKLVMLDSLNGYLGTSNGLYETNNGWKSFTNILPDFFVRSFDVSANGSLACSGVDLVKMEMGYRVSSNSGVSWHKHNNSYRFLQGHEEIRFLDDNTVYATQQIHHASITRDAGRSWIPFFLDSSFASVNSLFVIDKDEVLLSIRTVSYTESKTELFKSNDGGETWVSKNNFGDNGILELSMASNTIYGCGSFGLITKSVDYGETWVTIPKINNYHLVQLDFVTDDYGFVAGGMSSLYPLYGVIYRTKDGGNTWENVSPEGIKTTISGIDMIDENLGYAVDNDGVIYKTTNGGGPAKSDSVPKYGPDGKLWTGDNTQPKDTTTKELNTTDVVVKENAIQLFPNPTKDKVSVTISSELGAGFSYTLKDSHGKVVRDKQQVGKSNVVLDISNYANGVYYLQLEGDNWQSVKKVVKE